MCREHLAQDGRGDWVDGSSPRVQGTQVGHDGSVQGLLAVHPRVCREHAINLALALSTYTVHPRVCREHGNQSSIGKGSPSTVHPRVCREHKPQRPWCRGLGHRFIPACAGNTQPLISRKTHKSVHPRVCREHLLQFGHTHRLNGSSPRVWGTPPLVALTNKTNRFIPACAGNTFRPVCFARCLTGSSPRVQGTLPTRMPVIACNSVHPRVCREHGLADNIEIMASAGSSPRVQGTRLGRQHADHGRRFIPACAGDTDSCHSPRWKVPVHPRVCREHAIAAYGIHHRYGSSPRVQGTHTTVHAFIYFLGFPVHPRVCREHGFYAGQSKGIATVHPRVCREHSLPTHHRTSQTRFIPACAGNTNGIRADRRLCCSVHPRVCREHIQSR